MRIINDTYVVFGRYGADKMTLARKQAVFSMCKSKSWQSEGFRKVIIISDA